MLLGTAWLVTVPQLEIQYCSRDKFEAFSKVCWRIPPSHLGIRVAWQFVIFKWEGVDLDHVPYIKVLPDGSISIPGDWAQTRPTRKTQQLTTNMIERITHVSAFLGTIE